MFGLLTEGCLSVSLGHCECEWLDRRGERVGWMDGSQRVSPKALTPGGFDAIFPRREPTWEELVNNICPSSERLTPTTLPQPPHLRTHTHTDWHTQTHSSAGCQSCRTHTSVTTPDRPAPSWTYRALQARPAEIRGKGLLEIPAIADQCQYILSLLLNWNGAW